MDTLEERLIKNKPNVSKSSIRTYKSILKNLYYRHHNKDDKMNLDWFDNQDNVIELLKDSPYASRRTTYASLIAVTSNNDKYKIAHNNDAKKYTEFVNTQTKTPSQEENWIDYSEVQTLYDKYYEKAKPLLKMKKEDLNRHDESIITDFIVLSITCGIWFPPRRNLDWIMMKIRNFNDKTDNFLDLENKQFVFNIYKTAKFYDTQKVDIPKKFLKILKKFILINDSDYLLVNGKHEPYTTQRMTQKMNSLFHNKISTSMLRHIYLSDKLKDLPKLDELQKIATGMGHEIMTAFTYIKK